MKRQKKNHDVSTSVDKQSTKMTIQVKDDASSVNQKNDSGKSNTSASDGKNKRTKKKNRKPRLIVRNLSFKATEDSVRKHFEQFGEVSGVDLLRKPNKQLVGCGFVQFTTNTSAAKAIARASGRPFMGRPIAVDWAVPKDIYTSKTKGSVNEEGVKPEIEEDVKPEIKIEDVEPEIKIEDDDTSSESSEENDEDESDGDGDDGSEGDEDDDDDDDEDEDEDEDDSEDESFKKRKIKTEKPFENIKSEIKKERYESNDVTEGLTVFLRNLPFAVDNDRLHEFAEQFGSVFYAVVCVDPKSDHSRGTGFIKFKDPESVKQCLLQSQNKELVLDNRTIDASLALSRTDANKGKTEKVKKDNRNLYLLREGLITAGSPAAVGVSPSDMEKRIMLEQWKTKTLRDLTKFVSKLRLAIHNLPPTFTDEQLRTLFLKHGGSKPRLTEARIMRNLKDVDANGVGRSKEYGFVAFTSHENALEALRNLNNNPKVFEPNKRPIVAFCIEDRKMLNIRKRRQERSLMKNPTWKHYKKEEVKKEEVSDTKQTRKQKQKMKKTIAKKFTEEQKPEVGKKRKNSSSENSTPAPKVAKPFMGAVAKEGESQPMSIRKLRDQAESVRSNARLAKKKSRQNKKPERIKQPKQIKKERVETDRFSDIVDKYKSLLNNAPTPRAKWYE